MPIYPPLVTSKTSRRRDDTVLRQPVDLGVRIAAVAQHAAGIGADRLLSRPADIAGRAIEMRGNAGDAHFPEIRIVKCSDARAGDDMRILEKLLDVIDRSGGNVALMQDSKLSLIHISEPTRLGMNS